MFSFDVIVNCIATGIPAATPAPVTAEQPVLQYNTKCTHSIACAPY